MSTNDYPSQTPPVTDHWQNIKLNVQRHTQHISAELAADLLLKRVWHILLYDVLPLFPVALAGLPNALPDAICVLLLLATEGGEIVTW